jgi:ABC-type transporter Mla maintaining outer membrane lipid asymmetry ATPase subunit MlaF
MRAPRSFVEKNFDVNLRKEWWIVGGSGSNKTFPMKTIHKHWEVDKSARLIILARIILCNL